MQNEFRNEKIAKTSQGGDRSEAQVNLSDVFIDLSSSENPDAQNKHNLNSYHSVPILLKASARKLDPYSIEQCAIEKNKPHHAQYVFIGGPGSGKSTLGQFLSQINRAAILERVPTHKLQREIITEIENLKKTCDNSKFIWPKTPRYPYRIDLNQFAKVLTLDSQEGGVDSLSKYIRVKISKDIDLMHMQLLRWFAEFPSLLIFDGLDEVPISSNREQVIDQIQSFLGEIRQNESDALIISSSRPDGYRNEFDGMGVSHRYLLPLNKNEALKCSEKYLRNKYKHSDQKRFSENMEILKTSVNKPLVEKLMQSPLQVTFMVTVVSAFGKPSESRWKLFNDYYTTIYTRELQKSVPPYGEILEARRQDIDDLHHNVGFILQQRAELSGDTTADMGMDEFEKLVQKTLGDNGLTGGELNKEKQQIVGAAKERLVFLTSKKEGWLSFDVRSLQEYMAAMVITNTDSLDIIERLKMIATSSYWRNTLLFAVGQFFSDSRLRNQRDNIRILCDDLNREEGDVNQLMKPGSILALDILESGTLGNTPAFIRNLTAIALELLQNSTLENDYIKRLAGIYLEITEPEFKSELELRLGNRSIKQSLQSWLLAGFLRNRKINWVNNLISKFWPRSNTDIQLLSELLGSHSLLNENEEYALFEIYLSQKTSEVLATNAFKNLNFTGPLLKFPNLTKRSSTQIKAKLDNVNLSFNFTICEMSLSNIEDFQYLINEMKNIERDDSWNILICIYNFLIFPDEQSLEEAVKSIQVSPELINMEITQTICPWILLGALNMNEDRLFEYVKELGGAEFWRIAEQYLKRNKDAIPIERLSNFKVGNSSIDLLSAIENCSSGFTSNLTSVNKLIAKLDATPDLQKEKVLTSVLFHLSTNAKYLSQINIETLEKLFRGQAFSITFSRIPILQSTENINDRSIKKWIDFYENISRNFTIGTCHPSNFYDVESAVILRLYKDYPNSDFLLKIASVLCVGGVEISVDYNFILERAESSNNENELYFLIFELLACKDTESIGIKLQTIVKSKPEYYKNFILSFFANNGHSSVHLLCIFILSLDEQDWQIKSKAQAVFNKRIQSLGSKFTMKNLKELGLPA